MSTVTTIRRAQVAMAAHDASALIAITANSRGNRLMAQMMTAAADACLDELNDCVGLLRATAAALQPQAPQAGDGILRGNADIALLLADQPGGVQ